MVEWLVGPVRYCLECGTIWHPIKNKFKQEICANCRMARVIPIDSPNAVDAISQRYGRNSYWTVVNSCTRRSAWRAVRAKITSCGGCLLVVVLVVWAANRTDDMTKKANVSSQIGKSPLSVEDTILSFDPERMVFDYPATEFRNNFIKFTVNDRWWYWSFEERSKIVLEIDSAIRRRYSTAGWNITIPRGAEFELVAIRANEATPWLERNRGDVDAGIAVTRPSTMPSK